MSYRTAWNGRQPGMDVGFTWTWQLYWDSIHSCMLKKYGHIHSRGNVCYTYIYWSRLISDIGGTPHWQKASLRREREQSTQICLTRCNENPPYQSYPTTESFGIEIQPDLLYHFYVTKSHRSILHTTKHMPIRTVILPWTKIVYTSTKMLFHSSLASHGLTLSSYPQWAQVSCFHLPRSLFFVQRILQINTRHLSLLSAYWNPYQQMDALWVHDTHLQHLSSTSVGGVR